MESQSWNAIEAEVTEIIEMLAQSMGTTNIDNGFSFSSQVPGGFITVSFCFRYNEDNRKIWATQTISKMIDGREFGGNTFCDHREHDHPVEWLREMLSEWIDEIPNTIAQYKDDCSYYEYLAGK